MRISARAIFQPRDDLGRFVEANVGPAVVASVEAACTTIQQRAQELCPVDTGALRESIAVEIDASGKTVVGRVVAGVDYAEYVEFGTGSRGDPAVPHRPDWPGMPAQPYMRPALDESKRSVEDLFAGQVGVALGR
jgi:HK97 gp10 family phage protein